MTKFFHWQKALFPCWGGYVQRIHVCRILITNNKNCLGLFNFIKLNEKYKLGTILCIYSKIQTISRKT